MDWRVAIYAVRLCRMPLIGAASFRNDRLGLSAGIQCIGDAVDGSAQSGSALARVSFRRCRSALCVALLVVGLVPWSVAPAGGNIRHRSGGTTGLAVPTVQLELLSCPGPPNGPERVAAMERIMGMSCC